jgi:HAD superfamily hydrolase (TIGR01509 family)
MKNLKHVYFDVGGVVILDYSGTDKWTRMKRDLGVTQDQDEIFDSIWKKYRSRICLDCDVDTIISDFESELGLKFSDDYSMLQDFVNRFEKNSSMWPIIQLAKEKYSVGLLTNMYPRMLNAIKDKELIPSIDWDVVIDSSIVGYQKPDAGIYQVAEELAGVKPESIFFVDNSQEHVMAAKSADGKRCSMIPKIPKHLVKKLLKNLG